MNKASPNKCTVERIMERAPWLTLRLAKKKFRIVQNAVTAENRGDKRGYAKWAKANAKFDCRFQPEGFK